MPLRPRLPLDFQIKTDRMILRRFTEADTSSVYQHVCASQNELAAYLAWAAVPHYTFEMLHRHFCVGNLGWHDGKFFFFVGCDAQTGEILLSIDLRYEDDPPASYTLGYMTFAHATGKGYMTEATQAITDAAFKDLHAQRVVLEAVAPNTASQRVAHKAGFLQEGRAANGSVLPDGSPVDLTVFAHTPKTWKDFKHARQN